MFMTGAYRAPLTLLMAAAAGALLWVAATQVDRGTTGGYWAAYGLVALAGVALGLSGLRGAGGNPPALLGAFLPVLGVALWILAAMQPHATWTSTHVRTWSGDLHVLGPVLSIGTWLGVVAFGVGVVLAGVLEPVGGGRRRAVVEQAVVDETAADEPLAAERETMVR